MTLKEFLRIIDGTCSAPDCSTTIDISTDILPNISTDSRVIRPGQIFFALDGKNYRGSDFARAALDRGAAFAVVHEGYKPENNPEKYIFVKDVLRSLQAYAMYHRQQFDIPVIAVVGSVGKTTTKDILATILSEKYNVHKTHSNHSGQLGVALTLLAMNNRHEISVVECAVNHKKEMERLAEMVRPDCVILTSITKVHLKNFGDLKSIAEEKFKMFRRLNGGTAILPLDCKYFNYFYDKAKGKKITVGKSSNADYRIEGTTPLGLQGYDFVLKNGHKSNKYHLPVIGEMNVLNASLSIAAATLYGLSIKEIEAGLLKVSLPKMRMEIFTSSFIKENITIINDSYNASPGAVRTAVKTLLELGSGRRKILVLGDMLELGIFSKRNHREIADFLKEHRVDFLLTIGKETRITHNSLSKHSYYKDKLYHTDLNYQASEFLRDFIRENDIILIKASRVMQLENVAMELKSSIRPTKVFISLGAVAHNTREMKKLQPESTHLMAVVKSNAYGHSAPEVSRTVLKNGADELAVAIPDEGIQLRKAGIDAPVLVLGATNPVEAEKILHYGFGQVITDIALAEELNRLGQRYGKKVNIHLKIDTGMNRIGVQAEELESFLLKLKNLRNLHLAGTMSHLSSADMENEKEFTQNQIKKFSNALEIVKKHYGDPGTVHLANSAGVINYPDAHFGMVRCGIALYGLYPSGFGQEKVKLQPAMSFVTEISLVKAIKKGESVSYGRKFVADKDMRIATLPVGYNDGYNRLLSNCGQVLIRGQKAPVLGTVAMDMTMVDITHIPGACIGDEVVLFGRQGDSEIHIDEIADEIGTINYEVICSIDPRVPRCFLWAEG